MLRGTEYFPQSLRITQNGTIWKLGYGFLFAFHSSYGSHILYHFRNEAIYWPKVSIFHIHHMHSTLPLDDSLSERCCHTVWYGETRMMWLTNGEKKSDDIFSHFNRIPGCDGQTSWESIVRTASHGNKTGHTFVLCMEKQCE